MIFVIRNNSTIHIPSNEVRVGDRLITSGSTPQLIINMSEQHTVDSGDLVSIYTRTGTFTIINN